MDRPQQCAGAPGPASEALESLDWTSTLPDEVLELVLAEVPAHDLAASARRVCRRWRRVLSGRSVWRRVRLDVRVGHEQEACRVLRVAPALAELALFPGDRQPTSAARALLRALRDAVDAGLEVRALALDWRHFAADAASRACFHGVLAAMQGARLAELDVGLVGVRPVDDAASPQHPQPAPAIAALAALAGLRSLRLQALFDPCWYFDELRGVPDDNGEVLAPPFPLLQVLDATGCQPYLWRLLGDVLHAHAATLRAVRLTARSLAAMAQLALPLPGHLPALQHLTVDLEQQDDAVAVDEAMQAGLLRLTLARVNRRLPTPGRDALSEAVQSVCASFQGHGQGHGHGRRKRPRPWPALRMLVLEDCLVSPADLAALLRGLGGLGADSNGLAVRRVLLHGGCFLGSPQSFEAVTTMAPDNGEGEPRVQLLCRGLRHCPRDPDTGLYALALQ